MLDSLFTLNSLFFFLIKLKRGHPLNPYLRGNFLVGKQARGRGTLSTQRPKASKLAKYFPPDSNLDRRVERRVRVSIEHCPLDNSLFYLFLSDA